MLKPLPACFTSILTTGCLPSPNTGSLSIELNDCTYSQLLKSDIREKKVGERVMNLPNPTRYSRMTAKKQLLVLIYSQFNTAGNSK